jgi:octaprenyl-diphosphate synthase
LDIIKQIHGYLADEMKLMNNIILDRLATDEELISLISHHLNNSGGKRLRPVLTILSSKIFAYEGQRALALAAAIEFIHMATLLHDDVVDGSKMRRFLPTANVIWGEKASILVGDFLFSQAFQLIVSTKLIPAMETLSHVSSVISQGEVAQLVQLQERRLISVDEYFKVIEAKTAALFGASCRVGAMVAGSDEMAQVMHEFGLCLGRIFQIVDDKLDYLSNNKDMGKNCGDDFYEGKVTLPLILLSHELPADDSAYLQVLLQQQERNEEQLDWVKTKMVQHDILKKLEYYTSDIHAVAMMHLQLVSAKNLEAKEYMHQLLHFATHREY